MVANDTDKQAASESESQQAAAAAAPAAGEASTAPAAEADAGPSSASLLENADELLKAFFNDLKDTDRDNEVNRILWAFKLNPYEKLNLRFDASVEDVRKQYRKLSLMVHPDKCKHPQASTAFDVLGDAQKELMDDEKREHLHKVLDIAREEVRKDWRKETKHDNLVRVQSLLHDSGKAGIAEEWEKTDDFHEKWKLKARETLANMEWRKRKLGKRLKEETARLEGVAQEKAEKVKKTKAAEKEWEATREQRVATWRDFAGKKSGKAVGELKPPKQRANDEDKLYVRRPVKEDEMRPEQQPTQKANHMPKVQQQ